MRAMVIEEPRALEQDPLVAGQLPEPAPGPDELLVRVEACAVCLTDIQLATGELAARRLPIVPGHQVVGRVEAVGAAVRTWVPGDRAGVIWLAEVCGRCRFCLSGRENLCESVRFTGWDQDGGYAEFLTAKADFALRMPPGLAPASAAPLLCGGVIGYRSLRRSGIQPGGRLGLYGYGASARLAIQVARHWGCRVFVATRSRRERERALEAGAHWAGAYDDPPPELLDAAITFAPSGDVVLAALRALDRGGVVAVNAIHLDRIPEFSYDRLWWERGLVSVANVTREDAGEFLALTAEIGIQTEVEVFSLEQANEAMRRHAAGALTGTAVLVPPGVS